MYDNIAHSATINSHRFHRADAAQCRVTKINTKLKALRERSGLSVRKLAAELDMPASTYAAYEDPAKFKKPILPLEFAKKIAAIFEPLGIGPNEVLELAGVTGALSTVSAGIDLGESAEWLEVHGAVAAGVWRAQTDWPEGERYLVRFGPSKYRVDQRFAVRMDGLSMNKTIPSGADLECLWVKFSPLPPKPGDLVIVERKAHDLVELTCKRLTMVGDNFALICESTEPEFQGGPIFVGKPDNGLVTDDGIEVVGIVLNAKLDLAPRDLSERRYRH
jgi:transcriptional regulator with XRE-family HTH domain